MAVDSLKLPDIIEAIEGWKEYVQPNTYVPNLISDTKLMVKTPHAHALTPNCNS
jgi:hypothetical protein